MAKPTAQTTFLQAAERDLSRALREGRDTAQARERLAQARSAAEQAQHETQTAQAEFRQDRAERLDSEATAAMFQAQRGILAELDALLPGNEIIVDIVSLHAAALKLAEAQEAQAEAEEQRGVIAEELATLTTREHELQKERTTILAQRRPGDFEQAGRIGLIDADLDDIRAMVADQQNALRAVKAPDLYTSTRVWETAVKNARAAARLALAAELERRLLITAQALKAEANPGGMAGRWRPSPNMRDAAARGVF
jgi:hypothetical protein